MFKKFNILIILLLLLISVAAVSAADDMNETLSSDEDNADTIEVSDIDDALDSNDESDVLSASHDISSSNYNSYFDANGKLKDDTISSGDTIRLSGSFNNKTFIFNKTVNVVGNSGNSLSESMITFLSGASGSTVSNLNIKNDLDQTYGIFLNGVSNCVISGCTIVNHGKSSYPICLANGATYNNVTDNALTTSGVTYGHGTRSTPTLLLSGSNNNYVANNVLNVDDANAIYLSSYNGGPITGGLSNYNLIYNNTIQYHVLPTSWSYAIQIMGSYNNIKGNKIFGAYRGISTSGPYNNITENWIIDLTGADYNNKNVEVGGEYGIAAAAYSLVADNHIVNAKIISTGAGISVIDHSTVKNNIIEITSKGAGVSVAGNGIVVQNNNITTETGVGIFERDEGSGLTINKNNITSVSGVGVLVEKLSSKRMPSNVAVTNNIISTSSSVAIDLSGVKEGTGVVENNKIIGGGQIKLPSGIYDSNRPSYKFDENKTYIIDSSNIGSFIDDNGDLYGVDDGSILIFKGEFSNEVIYVTKSVKIIGDNAKFLNSTFKVTSGGVWIENLTIINKNAERLNAWGIYVNGATGVKIINNDISVNDPNAAYAVYVLESSYVEVIDNDLFSDGEFLTFTILVYSSEDCIFANNTIKTLGTGESYKFSPESKIESTIYYINGTEVCVDGNELCIDGVTYCLDGNEVCIDGVTYCLDGDNGLVVDGKRYVLNETNEVCIDGVTYCLDGNELVVDGVRYSIVNNEVCIDGVTYCLDGDNGLVVNGKRYVLNETNEVCIDGVTYCLDGNELCIDGKVYCLDGNEVCIDGVTYCLDGNDLIVGGVRHSIVDNEVCIDGVTYCLDGNELKINDTVYHFENNEVCIDGKVYCLDGNELVLKGTSYGVTSHVVPEIYRTYGILLLYSSSNEVSGNTVNVTSKISEALPISGNDSSENSIVGIDIYYNSHNNNITNNIVNVYGKDNYIYGMGVLGAKSGHDAPEGQGATNNRFIDNKITLDGNYAVTGIIVGDESEGTIINSNNIVISSDAIIYGITLEMSDSTSIESNTLTLNSDVTVGIQGYSSNDNLINENTLNAYGKQVYGMIFSGMNYVITNNDIYARGTGENITLPNRDSLGYGNAGIHISGNSTNNIIKSNNIISQTGYAIESETSGNTIEDNYLQSEKGNSTEAINGSEGNTVKDNYINRVNGTFEFAEIPYLCSGDLVLNLKNNDLSLIEGAIVSFYDIDDVLIGNSTVNNGIAKLNFKLDSSYEFGALYNMKAVFYKKDFQVTAFTTQIIVGLGNLNVVVNDASAKEELKAKFTATITNGLGKPVKGLTVKFYNFDTGNRQAIGTATTDSNGVATISYHIDKYFEEDFGTVTHVTAVVSESDLYASSNSSGKLTIIDIAPITVKMVNKLSFNSVLATLTDNNGFAVANKKVSVTIDGKTHNVNTNANGQVILPSVGAGSHTITVSSAKDSHYDSASANAKVTVVACISGNKNANAYYGNTLTYKIRIADKNGNYLGANKAISIKVNGKVQKLKTDKNGYVSYSVKKVGTYTITAEYNGQKVSNKLVIKPTLIAKNISKKKAKKIKFSVKVLNKKGKILKKKKVTFKIKGKKYTAKTNKKGVATVTLKKLKVGKHTIKSSYGGCTISNKITIKK